LLYWRNMRAAIAESRIISGSPIADSELIKLIEHPDSRGSFTEVFVKKWGTILDPVQHSVVKSEAEVLRGMHFHRRHDEYFCLIKGHCYLGLKDMREASVTYLEHALYELHENDPATLIFPKGVLHGWYFSRDSIHLQAVSEAYSDYGSDDNLGCRWNDPELQIPWPFEKAVLSERAQGFPSFKEFTSALRNG